MHSRIHPTYTCIIFIRAIYVTYIYIHYILYRMLANIDEINEFIICGSIYYGIARPIYSSKSSNGR